MFRSCQGRGTQMGFMDAIASAFRKYVDFSGRASRSEYWYWALFVFVASACLSALDAAVFPGTGWNPLSTVFSLAVLLPYLAVAVRRLHDVNRSGFWIFLWLLPVIGFL